MMSARRRRDRRLPHLRLGPVEHAAVVVERAARRRTASSSARRWRRSPATIAMCSGTICTSFWPKPRIASSGRFWSRSSVAPNVLAAGRGRSIGHRLADAPLGDARRPSRSTPRSRAILANGMLQLRVNTSVRSPPHVVPSKFSIGSSVCGGTNSLSSGNVGRRSTTPFSQGDAGGQDLERRARHVALLVGVGRAAGRRAALEEREHVAGARRSRGRRSRLGS